MIQYMPILSIPMLNKFKRLVNFQYGFILGQFLDVKQYREFWLSYHWQKVIIDNGQYENDYVPFDRILDFADEISANEVIVILPDSRFDPQSTFELWLEYRNCTDHTEAFVVHDPTLKLIPAADMYAIPQEVRAENQYIPEKLHGRKHALGFYSFNDRLQGYESFDTSYPFTRAFRGVPIQQEEGVRRLPIRSGRFPIEQAIKYLNQFLEILKQKGLEVTL